MKRFLLTLTVILAGYVTYAQVVCAGISPASIQGNYDFGIQANCGLWPGETDDGTWGAWTGGLDFNNPGDYIQGELMLVEDGTQGTNPQGNPISQEGCNPLTNNLTGKIAVVYRNTCWFSSKVYYAEQAGAIGVIIVNREPGIMGMLGNTDPLNGPLGADCHIPAVFLSDVDGANLISEMSNGPVTMFIGNKIGAFANDAGINSNTTLVPKMSGVPSQIATNATDFNFDLGTRIYNYGTQNQNNISLNASIDGPTGNVYNQTAAGITIPTGDSVDVFPGGSYSLPQFGLASFPDGRYTLTYTVDLGTTDDFASDNVRQVDFVIQDSIYTLANTDVSTNHPISNGGFRPSTNTSTFSQCISFQHPNANQIAFGGMYFSATTAADPTTGNPIDLSGEEIALYLYRWEDVFTDLNDANLAFNNLSPVGIGYYYYPSDLQGETVYGGFDSPVQLENDQRYLLCVQTVNLDLYLGFDNVRNYLWNEAYYLQPLGPIESDGTYYASGFGMEYVPAIGARIVQTGISESNSIEGSAFPNPATDVVTINVEATGNATLTVTDIAGRTAMTTNVGLANGTAEVNIDSLESGVYVFNVSFEDGRTSQFNVVKK